MSKLNPMQWRLLIWCNNRVVRSHPDPSLIEEAQPMLERDWNVEISHVPCTANSVADHLPKQALNTLLEVFGG